MRQRQNTNDLLASTDASLQKLSGRQLTQDEQETVGQIRKFMQQVKEADKEGDLQRAYKLAVKAHLLSDFHPKGAVAQQYGTYIDGIGIAGRATFVIDKDGKVVHKVTSEVLQPRDQQEYLTALAACPV